MSDDALNQRLLDAHANGDSQTMVDIYKGAGDAALFAGDTHAGCFYLTHAYVFALEAGMPIATKIHKTLKQYGREE